MRQTVHPYFDALHVQYLKCTVSYDTDFCVTFTIEPDQAHPDYSTYLHTIVEQHFRTYGLARKFKAEASRKVVDFRTNMAKVAEDGPIRLQDVDREIRYEVNKAIGQKEGPNSWILSFWEGIRSCPDLVVKLNGDLVIQRAVATAGSGPAA